jgi:hypothetical protein
MAETRNQSKEVGVMSSTPILEARPSAVEYDGIPGPDLGASTFSQKDAEELKARRAADAKREAKLRGWKPLTIWYSFWAIVIAIGVLSSLGSGHVGTALIGCGICAACIKYAHYLYNGGRRRVWFFIW